MKQAEKFRLLMFFSVIMVLLVFNPLVMGKNLHPVKQDQTSNHDIINPEVPPAILIILASESKRELTIANGRIKDNDAVLQHQIEKLRGKTLDIYCLLMENQDEYGVREIQRHFGYSSPNLATYHLDKLLNMNLVEKSASNQYRINPDSQPAGPYQQQVLVFGSWIDINTIIGVISIILALLGCLVYLLNISNLIIQLFPVLTLFSIGLFLLKSQH